MKKVIEVSLVGSFLMTFVTLVFTAGYTLGWNLDNPPADLWLGCALFILWFIATAGVQSVYDRGIKDAYERMKRLDSIDEKGDEQ